MINDFYLFWKIMLLKVHEHQSQSTIIKIRERKLRRLLKFAYRKSSFYHELYNKSGIGFNDLYNIPIESLPSIDKHMVINNLAQIITRPEIQIDALLEFSQTHRNSEDLYRGKYQIIHTSGSSGEFGVFVYNKWEFNEAFSCGTRMFSLNLGSKKRIAYYAAVDDRFGGVALMSRFQKGLLKTLYDICLLDINEPLATTIQKLNEFQPDVLVGYGTGLGILASCQQKRELKIHPEIVENGGEGLDDYNLQLIKQVFQVPIINMYAASETYYLGIGKDEYNGIYLMDDLNYIEIFPEYLLVTNLYNYTQPTIRYRIDDRLFLKHDRMSKLPFRLVESVIGRSEKLLWFINVKGEKDYIHPIVFTSLFITGLTKIQIIVKSDISFICLAILSEKIEKSRVLNELKLILDNILAKKEMSNVTYEIKQVDSPFIDPVSRKFKLIIYEKANLEVDDNVKI